MSTKKRVKSRKPATTKKLNIKSLKIDGRPVDPTLPAAGYADTKTVLAHFGFGNTTLWRLVKAGKFPAPVSLSTRRVGFDVADLQAHKEKLRGGVA